MKQGGFLPEDLARVDLPSTAANLVRLLKALGFLAYACDDECVGIAGHQIDSDEERLTCAQRWLSLWDTEHLFLERASTCSQWRWSLGPFTTEDERRECESVEQLVESLLTAMDRPEPWLDRWDAVSGDYVDRGRAAMNGEA